MWLETPSAARPKTPGQAMIIETYQISNLHISRKAAKFTKRLMLRVPERQFLHAVLPKPQTCLSKVTRCFRCVLAPSRGINVVSGKNPCGSRPPMRQPKHHPEVRASDRFSYFGRERRSIRDNATTSKPHYTDSQSHLPRLRTKQTSNDCRIIGFTSGSSSSLFRETTNFQL